jgi:predicted TIM-barrel fold metal-dependent hydrolase
MHMALDTDITRGTERDTVVEPTDLVIDADAHVVETERTWDYLEASERKFRPQIVANADGTKRYWLIDGKIAGLRTAATNDDVIAERTAATARNVSVDPAARKMEDIDRRLRHMTELGVDVQVLHNSVWIEQMTDRPDIEIALCRSWNRWLADIWGQSAGRLRWTCVVPTLDLDAAVAELRFAKDHGAVGVCVRPFDGELMMLDPYFYPIYASAEDLDLAVAVHIANGDPTLVNILRTRFSLLDGFSMFRFPTVLACYGLLRSELPSLFPRLRWGFIEASAQWVPWVLHELARRDGVVYTAEDNPFRRDRVFVAMQTDDDHDYIEGQVGTDTLVIGTDYGHTDTSSEVDAISIFRGSTVDSGAQRRVLSVNPARLYGLG